jgi:HK97 family phage major capsid protein
MHPRLQEIQERLAAIRALLDTPEADVDALDTEVRALQAERATIEAAIQKRQALVAAVADGGGSFGSVVGAQVIRTFPSQAAQPEERTFDAASPEYRSAWLKQMAHNPKTGEWRLGELTEIEKRAYTYPTAVTDAIPTGISLGIVEMISKQYALLNDISPTGFSGVVEFVQATPIAAGKAAETAENTANANDLQITFTKVSMTGVEIKGQVKIGAKMRIQSMEGFEAFLVGELSREMGEAMNLHVIDAVDDDMALGNKLTPATLEAADIREAFGLLKGGKGARVVYANGATIWNDIASVVDEDGNEKFIADSMNSDPSTQGRIYGSAVKLDDTIDDDVIFVGYPAQVKANTFQAPNVLADMPDVTTREMVYGGYALFEARLGDTRSWAKITITAVS